MLQLTQICKSFKNHQVLNDVDLFISKGKTLGLIGANGEGKTTLFKCLLNVCGIDSGNIMIDQMPHSQPQARSQLAFLPEHFQAPYYLNGQEFLALLLKLQQTSYQQDNFERILTTLLFDNKALNKPVRSYSKGMMQKLGLTACLCSDKPLLILDEPMSGLDPAARYGLKQLLLEQKKRGKTILFSTHLLHDIESICDRLAILASGQIRFVGSMTEVLKTFNASSLENAYLQCLETLGQQRQS